MWKVPETTEQCIQWRPFFRGNFRRADLTGVDVFGGYFREAVFNRADLTSATLIGGDFTDAKFEGATLRSVDLSPTHGEEGECSKLIEQTRYEHEPVNCEKLPDDNRKEIEKCRTVLTRAYLAGADLSEAKLLFADLTGANLKPGYTDDGKERGAILKGTWLNCTKLACAKLGRADLSNARLRGADLRCADLSGAILTGADLTDANLTDAKLKGVQGLTPRQLESAKGVRDPQQDLGASCCEECGAIARVSQGCSVK